MIERYTRPQMARIWTLHNKYQTWLEVELLACEAWAELGVLPKAEVATLKRFTVDDAFVERVAEIEAEVRHDVIAFTQAVAERLGPGPSKYIHYGLTSTDVVDTALSYNLVQAIDLLSEGLERLRQAVGRRAVAEKYTLCMGRTHGVHAEPTTFGLKLALWYAELGRAAERLQRCRAVAAVGKLSGAVGNYGNSDPFIEAYVCQRLGLEPAPISTQTLQRDRHAEVIAHLAVIGGTLEKMALEIRGLQKTEVREVEEPFGRRQKGSSAMPHKKNPVVCEQICGLARLLRGYVQPALENMALWHERDISHSSVERVILPDATVLLDYLLDRMTWVIEGMTIHRERMRQNLQASFGLPFSGRVLLALVEKGHSREEAYRLVQQRALQAWADERPFAELLAADPEVALTEAELARCFDPAPWLRHVDTVFTRLGLGGEADA